MSCLKERKWNTAKPNYILSAVCLSIIDKPYRQQTSILTLRYWYKQIDIQLDNILSTTVSDLKKKPTLSMVRVLNNKVLKKKIACLKYNIFTCLTACTLLMQWFPYRVLRACTCFRISALYCSSCPSTFSSLLKSTYPLCKILNWVYAVRAKKLTQLCSYQEITYRLQSYNIHRARSFVIYLG